MMQIANFHAREWAKHSIYNYSVWSHRLTRAIEAEIKQLPEKPRPLPWPVYQKPPDQMQRVNEALYPKFGEQFAGKPKPKVGKNLTSYVPRAICQSLARTEVYRGEDGDNFMLRVKKCWEHPRPWSIEAVVDPGGDVYLPYFREVTIRLPLKAKICRELSANRDGTWVGACRSVKKLNAREALIEVTKTLLEKGQAIRKPIDSGQWTMDNEQRTAGRPDIDRTNHPKVASDLFPSMPMAPSSNFSQREKGGSLGRAARGSANSERLIANGSSRANSERLIANGSSPANSEQLTANTSSGSASAAHGSLLTAHSPGLAAYRAKAVARERVTTQTELQRRLPLEGALHFEGFTWPRDRDLWQRRTWREIEQEEREREQLREAETDVIRVMMDRPGMTHGFLYYVPAFLKQDDLDGYLVTRREVGPDPHHHLLPDPKYRSAKWWRGFGRWGGKKKRFLTARERLARIQPSIKIVPTGPRSAELVITRRMHEVNIGLEDALNLARMIEGAIKYRNPLKPNRKQSWRQELRSRLVNDAGRFVWLVRNPINTIDSGKAIDSGQGTRKAMDKGKWRRDNEGLKTLDLGRFDEDALRAAYRRCPRLAELYPEAGLPERYLELVDRRWLTEDRHLFAATPAGAFATKVEGFPFRLPLAVMPPAAYERWLARGGDHPRRRRRRRQRRTRSGAGCRCYLADTRRGRSLAEARTQGGPPFSPPGVRDASPGSGVSAPYSVSSNHELTACGLPQRPG